MQAGAKLECQLHGIKPGVAEKKTEGIEIWVCDFLDLGCRFLPIIINGFAWWRVGKEAGL